MRYRLSGSSSDAEGYAAPRPLRVTINPFEAADSGWERLQRSRRVPPRSESLPNDGTRRCSRPSAAARRRPPPEPCSRLRRCARLEEV